MQKELKPFQDIIHQFRDTYLNNVLPNYAGVRRWIISPEDNEIFKLCMQTECTENASIIDIIIELKTPFEGQNNYERLLIDELIDIINNQDFFCKNLALDVSWQLKERQSFLDAVQHLLLYFNLPENQCLILFINPTNITHVNEWENFWLSILTRFTLEKQCYFFITDKVDNPLLQLIQDIQSDIVLNISLPFSSLSLMKSFLHDHDEENERDMLRTYLIGYSLALKEGKKDEMKLKLDKAIELAEKNKWHIDLCTLYMLEGGVFISEKQYEKGISSYKKSLEYNKLIKEYAQNLYFVTVLLLAKAYVQHNEMDEALQTLSQMLENVDNTIPNNKIHQYNALELRSEIYTKMNEFDLAWSSQWEALCTANHLAESNRKSLSLEQFAKQHYTLTNELGYSNHLTELNELMSNLFSNT